MAEKKLIYPENNLQKCEPLKSRFRENLGSSEKRLLDNCFECEGELGKEKLKKYNNGMSPICIFKVLLEIT